MLTTIMAGDDSLPPDLDVLLSALEKDLTAIRNNSRSTAGDPWRRLQGNVGRAEIAMARIHDYRHKETP